ncbi:TauD/TfdA family dioxygenase [Candidatus Pelagibacter sp.]|nr:TauD/TfdA family dioxygenase [Candidatus Pelagibacter sp.]
MIKNIKILPDKINILFSNNKEDNFLNIWLRDHARDEDSWDHRSNQRKIFTAKLDPKLHIKKAILKDNGKSVDILWSDLKKPINYSSNFFLENSNKSQKINNNIKIWDKKDIGEEIYTDFQSTITNDGFKEFLEKLYKFGFVVIQNCKTEMSSVEKIANKIGYVRESIFGGLWSFESNNDMADSAYTQDELRPHTDSTYSNDAPGLQLLLCCHYEATGGESIMVDGFKIAEKIYKENRDLYTLLSEIEVTGQYIGDGVFLEAKRPIFKLNSNKELVQVSFNNYDRAAFRMDDEKTLKFYDAIREFDLIANNREYQWRHILKPGELLIFNNWRILHGRGSFKGDRKMSGCYINKEDFDSSCRMNKVI